MIFRNTVFVIAAVTVLAACGDKPAPVTQPAVEIATEPNTPVPVDHDRPRLQVALVDGGQYNLAAHRGKWVVVNFWATWCGPCLKEMPELSTLASARKDVDVIGLAFEDIDAKAMQAFLAEHKPTYPIAIIDTLKPPADFDAPRGLPMTVLVAPDGRVAKKVLGPVTLASITEAITQYKAIGGS